MIRLVVLDMAGTTVSDDGTVQSAFTAAIRQVRGTAPDAGMLDYVRRTMGESKISVFRALLDHDETLAQQANQAFEHAYAEQVAEGACSEIPGAGETIRMLRANGIKVALTTGFAEVTQRRIVQALGWDEIADLTLTPASSGRGRPYPDMVLTALMRLGIDDVREVAAVGDTAYDVRTGLRAGASMVAGVLTGAHGTTELADAGATHVLNSVRELPDLVVSQQDGHGEGAQ